MGWTSLCELGELIEGQGKYVEIGGFQLAVFLLPGGAVHVIDNTCPHAGGNLAGGFVEDGCAVCPWHYWSFRLDNGQMRDMPGVSIPVYKSRIFEQPEDKPKLVQAELPIF